MAFEPLSPRFKPIVFAIQLTHLFHNKQNDHFIYFVQLPNVLEMPTLTIIIFHTLYPNKKL
jgi:hypothetical protein